MTHEKIIKRYDGSRVKIVVTLSPYYIGADLEWRWHALRCEKGKRTFHSAVNHDDYSWRRLDTEGRAAEDRRRCLLIVSEDEVREAMQELISKIVPVV